MNQLKKYLPLALFLFLLITPASIFAGDFSNLNFIGFSKDGSFLAFEEYGTQDGSGFPYAKIYFIETKKNSYAAAPILVTLEKETATEAQARNKVSLLAAKTLLKFKIVKNNTGSHLLSHLPTDLTYDAEEPKTTETVRFAKIIGSMYKNGDYELSLKSVLTKPKDCETYGFDNYKLDLTLKNKETGSAVTLQKDAELPKARGCALDYAIREIFVHEDLIAVFIAYQTPGFEGPDSRFMAVTGKLN